MKPLTWAAVVTELGPALARVEEAIAANVARRSELASTINAYIVNAGGKRFRPALMIVSARLCGYRGDDTARLGTVLEYLHSATLLHDDILDEAAVRRGHPSANARWGNAAAVLSGDYLFSQAFAMLVEGYGREITLLLCRTAIELVEGEVMELSARRDPDLPEERYLAVIGHKTASLIAASAKAGALLAGAPPERAEALFRFGHGLGMAFQIIDDVLDYTGDERKFGKVPGGDLREGTVTLPLLRLLARLPEKEAARLREVVARADIPDDEVARVIDLVKETGAAEDCLAEARRHVETSRAELALFEDSAWRRMLDAAADYVLSRQT